jgi:hypothetical protein
MLTVPNSEVYGVNLLVMSLRSSQVLAPPPKGPGDDPSLIGGGKQLVFGKELQLEFRRYRDESEGDSETRLVWVRIITEEALVRFEIMDDARLYFLVESLIDPDKFEQLAQDNELSIDFGGLAKEVENLLTEGATQGSQIQVTFFEESDGTGTLIITQSLALKSVEILKLSFQAADPERVQAHVQHRFQALGLQLYEKKLRLLEFNKILRATNPLLLRAISSPTKSPPRK